MKGFRTTNLSAYFGCTVLVLGPVRLGMQIAFGRVRRKTAPTMCGYQLGFTFVQPNLRADG